MVLLAIETGLRWGELIALRSVDVDFTARAVRVERTVVEVSRKNSPTGKRTFIKNYPKDDEPRVVQIENATCRQLREHMVEYGIREAELLFHELGRNRHVPQSSSRSCVMVAGRRH